MGLNLQIFTIMKLKYIAKMYALTNFEYEKPKIHA